MAIQSRAKEFRQQLESRAMVADGAMGTMLYSKGVFINRCYDELNLSAFELVKGVHLEYVKAGAEILETNTFGANRMRLGGFGIADKLHAINHAGVRAAREAAGEEAFVAGSLGPLGAHIEPLGPTSFAEARDIFAEQIEALTEAGVDLLIFETFSNLDELREGVLAARQVAGEDLVVVAQVTIDDFGNLRDGTDTRTFARIMDQWPADVIGCNCSAGPKVTFETIEKMMQYSKKPVSAMPNAGHPSLVEGRKLYLCSPEYMAQYARRMLWAGAKIVGGCCGITPEHIRLVRAEARSLHPARRDFAATVETPVVRPQALPQVPMAQKSQLGAKIAAGKFIAFVEILPPRGTRYEAEIAASRLCAERGIDGINVPDGPRASARMSAQVTCQLIQQQAGIESVLHFCCRDRNILGIQSELLGAHAVGIRNLICITGDPPRMGSYPGATAVFDVDSIGLVNIVNNLNRGLDIGGNSMGSQTAFLIGVGANPGALNPEEELQRFEWKVQAGAEYVVTQPVFDLELLERFLERIDHVRIPVLAGIWPLTSYRNAEFMVNELRVSVPENLMERMRLAPNAEAAGQEGLAIAREMVTSVRHMVQGVQLSAPFGRYRTALEVAEALGVRE
jgi:methionine synthase I (cobalamin-dependent)/5,10-methylenetetrahydrofolate reductase